MGDETRCTCGHLWLAHDDDACRPDNEKCSCTGRTPSGTDLPDAVVDAAVEAMKRIVPNEDGVLWEFDDVIDQRTGMTQPHPVTLHDAARAALAAASGPWAEQLDAAKADPNQLTEAQMVEAFPKMREAFKREHGWRREAEAKLDAALARNAELEAEVRRQEELRKTVRVKYRRQRDDARAELDNLRNRVETVSALADSRDYPDKLVAGSTMAHEIRTALAIVRGSDDEDGGTCTCGESVPTVTTPGPCYWSENAPGVQSQVHCPPPDGVAR